MEDFLGPLNRLLARRVDRDGRAPSLETMEQEPQPAPQPSSQARRDRQFGLPREILDRALAEKILHGWLQNRHQVLMPLTLRLGQLRADDVEVLMRFAAASLLVAAQADAEERSAMISWLRSIEAIDESILIFEKALSAPSALSTLMERVRLRHLEAYAYAIATMAADLRTAPGRLYAEFVAAKLGLPPDAVRSINRRFRR